MANNVMAVSAGVADVRREPDPSSELVTQALMNAPAVAHGTSGEWTQVTLSDYEGWIRTDELEEPIARAYCKVGEDCRTPLQLMAVATTTRTSLYIDAEDDASSGNVYLSTALPLLDITGQERVQVALPGERSAWLARNAIDIREQQALYPLADISTILAYAGAFLGVRYLWGGTSCEGIDCSGFVQLCYRMGGSILPRDADQQYAFLQQDVERHEMRAGDLVFFGSQQITHVALALNDREYIHSEGQNYNCVTINSFDPADPHYYARLDEIVWGIKRVIHRGYGN